MQHIEDDHQRIVIVWADRTPLSTLKHSIVPGSSVGDYLFSVPNGGKRNKIEAARLKGLGVRAGIPDMMLAIPASGASGLFIELKRPIQRGKAKPQVSKSQRNKLDLFSRAGYVCAVCYGADNAIACIRDYLQNGISDKLHDNYQERPNNVLKK